MVLNVRRNHKAYQGRGEGGKGVGGEGDYNYTIATHQNDSCIKMGTDESHSNNYTISTHQNDSCIKMGTDESHSNL